MSVVCVACY